MIENTCGSTQKSVFGLSGVNGNDADLAIHAQNGGVGWINRECVSQIRPPLAKSPDGQNCSLDWPISFIAAQKRTPRLTGQKLAYRMSAVTLPSAPCSDAPFRAVFS